MFGLAEFFCFCSIWFFFRSWYLMMYRISPNSAKDDVSGMRWTYQFRGKIMIWRTAPRVCTRTRIGDWWIRALLYCILNSCYAVYIVQ